MKAQLTHLHKVTEMVMGFFVICKLPVNLMSHKDVNHNQPLTKLGLDPVSIGQQRDQ